MDLKQSNAEKPSQYYTTESRGEAPYTKRKSDTVRRRSLKGLRRELYGSPSTPHSSPYSNTTSHLQQPSPQSSNLDSSTQSSNDSILNQIPSLSHPCLSRTQSSRTSPISISNDDNDTETHQTEFSSEIQYITKAQLTNHLDQHYERMRIILKQYEHAADQRFAKLENRVVTGLLKVFHDAVCRSNLPASARAAFCAEIQADACTLDVHDCNEPNADNESIEQISDEFSEGDEADH